MILEILFRVPAGRLLPRPRRRAVIGGLIALAGLAAIAINGVARADGELTLEIVDSQTGEPIAARVHLRSMRKRSVPLRLPGTAEFGSHFYVDGKLTLPLRVGQYAMEIDGGPEYRTISSKPFEIEHFSSDTKRIEMQRFADLNAEGWWAGDLDVMRAPADLPLAMRAEHVNVVLNRLPNLKATSTARRRAARQSAEVPQDSLHVIDERAALDERFGGALLLFDAKLPPDLAKSDSFVPTSLAVVHGIRAAGGRAVARTPYAWDLPVWLASGELDAIQLIHHHSLREGAENREDDGRPRDRALFPGPSGNGRWSENVYHHVLNCGLRIPPVAGSGSGENDNPIGTNRVYAYCGSDFSYDQWWEAVESGRVFVTNGPLLRPLVEGKPPGHVFAIDDGETLELEIGLELATRTPVEYLQIVKNGQVEGEVRLSEFKGKAGKLPPVVFDSSGWFLVRAVTNNRRTYQFASSGPFYVEMAQNDRVSRRSVQFFLDWIAAAQERIERQKEISDADRAQLLAEQESARQFFEDLLGRANAD